MPPLLIHNAVLLSFPEGFRINSDSVLMEDGMIKAIGRYEDLKSVVQAGLPVLDAKGKTLMPGFNDSHIHIWKVGNLKTFMLDLRTAGSLDEMLSALSDYHKLFPEAKWITARGFNEARWSAPIMPTKKDLDRVSMEKPIYVIHTSAHRAVANSKALAIAGIHRDSKIPEGGEMQIGSDGQPNGIFSETALGLISNFLPPYSKSDLKAMVLAARDEMYAYGITAATDPAVDPLLMEVYQEMNHHRQLGFRLNAIPILLPDGSEIPYPIPNYVNTPFLTVNTVKFFSDGGLSSKTAAMKRPYKGSTDQGLLRLNRNKFLQLGRSAMEKGLGLATHAIGDQAIDLVIDVYRELHRDFPELIKRIEHLGLPDHRNLRDMAKDNISASMQAIFIYELGKNFIQSLDQNYLDFCYPIKSVLEAGILTALSSDAPVVQNFNPFKGIQTAISRKDSEGNPVALSESITLSESLKAYTADAARIGGRSDMGILEEGKNADIILLSQNPLTTATGDLESIKVEKTFIGGELVWERK